MEAGTIILASLQLQASALNPIPQILVGRQEQPNQVSKA